MDHQAISSKTNTDRNEIKRKETQTHKSVQQTINTDCFLYIYLFLHTKRAHLDG